MTRPTPSNLRAVLGNPGKRPARDDHPAPEPGSPPCPAWLTAEGREVWRGFAHELQQLGVLAVSDRAALELLVCSYLDVRALQAQVATEGCTFRARTVAGDLVTKRNPAYDLLLRARDQHLRLCAEFGLTPGGRARVHTVHRRQEAEAPAPRVRTSERAPRPPSSYFR